MAHDVFISYSTKDKAVADAVCAALEAQRVRCWIAPRDILPGAHWTKAIMKGLANARVMVLVFSGNSNSSPEVEREVHGAVQKGLAILPFRIENVPLDESLEFYLSTQHWLDAMTPPLEQHLKKLVEAVRALLSTMGNLEVSVDGNTNTTATGAAGNAAETSTGPSNLPREATSTKDDLDAEVTQAAQNAPTAVKAKPAGNVGVRTTSATGGPAKMGAGPSGGPSALLRELASIKDNSDEEARQAVQNALAAVKAKVTGGGSMSLSRVEDENAGAIWRSLHDSMKGREIPELRRIVLPRRDRDATLTHWKAITFLRYSLRMDEGRPHLAPVFAQMLLYDVHEPWEYVLKDAVDNTLRELPLPLPEKNKLVLECIRTGDEHRARDFLESLLAIITPQDAYESTRVALLELLSSRPALSLYAFAKAFEKITPADKRAETAAAILEHVERSPNKAHYVTGLFRAWDYREAIPRLRRLCSSVSDDVLSLLQLLVEWQDKESEPIIRSVVERYRYGNAKGKLDLAVTYLIAVANPDVDKYLVEVLQTASPDAQTTLLNGSLKKVRNSITEDAVKKLLDSSVDTAVRKAAAAYLGLDTNG